MFVPLAFIFGSYAHVNLSHSSASISKFAALARLLTLGLSDLGKYKLYYGQTNRNYTWSVDVVNQTTYTVTDLEPGQTYYFAVTAYDRLGKTQSIYSSEIQATIPFLSGTQMVGSFSHSPTTGTAPLNVNFTDTSFDNVTA